MRKLHGAVIGLAGMALGAGLAWAAADGGKFSGEYMFYSRELGDHGDPTPKDTKLLINIQGALAADIHRRMGKAAQTKDLCYSGNEWRDRGPMHCVRYKDGSETRCTVNFDLRSGKASGDIPC